MEFIRLAADGIMEAIDKTYISFDMKKKCIYVIRCIYLPVWGSVFFTKINRAFPGAKRSLLLKTWMNCPTDISRGTKYLKNTRGEGQTLQDNIDHKLINYLVTIGDSTKNYCSILQSCYNNYKWKRSEKERISGSHPCPWKEWRISYESIIYKIH